MPTPNEDYKGSSGQQRLADALGRQEILCNDPNTIAELVRVVQVEDYEVGEKIIAQQGGGDDLFFILEGSANICAQNRVIQKRLARTHVGELAMIDPEAGRSADVIATERTVVARLEGAHGRKIADQDGTNLWRNIARSLADRLREHTARVRNRNALPNIFIGSTSEALPVAQALKRAFAGDWATVSIWNDPQLFEASRTVIESLEAVIGKIDFAVLVTGDDDWTESRNVRQLSPRDNMIFEIGLAMGAIGRERTFIVTPRLGRNAVKWPSDLFGVTFAMFDPPSAIKSRLPWRRGKQVSYKGRSDDEMDSLLDDTGRGLIAQMQALGPY